MLQHYPLTELGQGLGAHRVSDSRILTDPGPAGEFRRSIGPRSPTAKRKNPKFRDSSRSSRVVAGPVGWRGRGRRPRWPTAAGSERLAGDEVEGQPAQLVNGRSEPIVEGRIGRA